MGGITWTHIFFDNYDFHENENFVANVFSTFWRIMYGRVGYIIFVIIPFWWLIILNLVTCFQFCYNCRSEVISTTEQLSLPLQPVDNSQYDTCVKSNVFYNFNWVYYLSHIAGNCFAFWLLVTVTTYFKRSTYLW